MSGEADLRDIRVLVIEDDYYLATDTARALQRAGAEIIGSCSNEQAAWDEIKRATPHSAVVDINLGKGPSFKLARELRRRGVPFVFMTGYDNDAIPLEFENVARLQKPVDPNQIVMLLSTAMGMRV